jgi:cysteine desulfurase/selenocysteine lyase
MPDCLNNINAVNREDVPLLREIAGRMLQEENRQAAAPFLPDDAVHPGGFVPKTANADNAVDLSSVYDSFRRLIAPFSASSSAHALSQTGELSGLYFPEDETSLLHSAATREFADTGYSRYSFLRDQPITYSGHETFDVQAIRKDFPVLRQKVNGKDLIWFDNAATTQKPRQVIDAVRKYYENDNSNIHRASHTLAARATDGYEGARKKAGDFIHAPSPDNILFVRGTTEGINLITQTYGRKFIHPGDEIVISTLDHHANIVPWQQLAREKNARLLVIPINDRGEIIPEEYERLLSPRTKIVTFPQVNNTFGTILPVKMMIDMAKRYGARVLIDGAQSVAHTAVDVQDLDVDFFVFSGHKIYAPNGIGVVYGKKELLELIPPWQGGGNMIKDVTFEETVFNVPPHKFEAGTPNVADAIGLGAALDYVSRTGIHRIEQYEHYLTEYARRELERIDGIKLTGNPRDRISVISFIVPGIPTPEVGKLLDKEGIALRAGHHCAQPALRRMGVEATVRPAFAFYNTTDEIDRLVEAVKRISAGQA